MDFDKRDFGNIKISKTVVEDIALHSYLDFKKKNYNDMKDRREAKNNISIELDEDENKNIVVKIKTKVKYGESIPHYCRLMQEKLKEDIENYTGYGVDEINIKVDDVQIVEENLYFSNTDNENNNGKEENDKSKNAEVKKEKKSVKSDDKKEIPENKDKKQKNNKDNNDEEGKKSGIKNNAEEAKKDSK